MATKRTATKKTKKKKVLQVFRPMWLKVTGSAAGRGAVRNFLQLDFVSVGLDQKHSQRFYFGNDGDEPERRRLINGMTKRALFEPFRMKWPETAQRLDPAMFEGRFVFGKLLPASDAWDSSHPLLVLQKRELVQGHCAGCGSEETGRDGLCDECFTNFLTWVGPRQELTEEDRSTLWARPVAVDQWLEETR